MTTRPSVIDALPDASAAAPRAAPSPPPRGFLGDRYQVLGLLGEGGMGSVWRARSVALDVDVAIKVLHREPKL